MAWEYLNDDIFETRYAIIVNYLYNKLSFGDVILDMNCGENANFINYFYDLDPSGEESYKYIGNDILIPKEKERNDYMALINLHDDEMLNWLIGNTFKIDVFMCLGDGAGENDGTGLESKTSYASGLSIIDCFSPSHVIIEVAKKYINRIGDYIRALDDRDYELVHHLNLDIDVVKYGFVGERKFCFWEKR